MIDEETLKALPQEDQVLIAQASLLGVRFQNFADGKFWRVEPTGVLSGDELADGWATLARCANAALYHIGVRTEAEFNDYARRTQDAVARVYEDKATLPVLKGVPNGN